MNEENSLKKRMEKFLGYDFHGCILVDQRSTHAINYSINSRKLLVYKRVIMPPPNG